MADFKDYQDNLIMDDVKKTTRRDFLKLVGAGAAMLLTPPLRAIGQSNKHNLPNIILCMTDDQGWGDVAYNGHPVIKTPALDAMAKASIRFDRFYAGSPVCSPTRCTCLTGRNNWRVNINKPTSEGQGHLPAEEITLAEAIKPAGYISGHFGKWHVGGFSQKTAPGHVMTPGMAGFDEWFSTYNVILTYDPYAKEHKQGPEALYWHNGRHIPMEEARKDKTMRGDDCAIIMNKAIDFIRKQTANEKIFMAFIWFHNVHTPLGKNPELMKLYPNASDQEKIYFSNITAIDRQMGRLRAELRKLGIADDTMLWFTSDNGPNLKGKKNVKHTPAQDGKFNYTPIGSSGAYRGWKRHLHEGGIREPGLLEWPAKIKRPFATSFPCVTSDLFPTVLAALGIDLPSDRAYDGINLLPLFEGKMKTRKKPIGFHAGGWDAWMEHRYKIVRQKGKTQWELYDLIDDPYEENDLSKEKPDVLNRMLNDWQKWAHSCQADCDRVIAKYYRNAKPAKKKKNKTKE